MIQLLMYFKKYTHTFLYNTLALDEGICFVNIHKHINKLIFTNISNTITLHISQITKC